MLKKNVHQRLHSKLYYYRTSHGVEVDLIIDHRQYRELIEIKTSETFHPKMVKSIESIINPTDKAFLLYRGLLGKSLFPDFLLIFEKNWRLLKYIYA